MKTRKIAAAILAVSLLASSGVFADNIGCGLGRMLFKGKQGKMWELFGVTLNDFACTDLIAISFELQPLGYQKNAKISMAETNNFIAANLDSLASDIAKGNGEYIDTLSNMLKVSDPVAFKSTLQQNFTAIFASENTSASEVSAKIYSFVS